MDSALFADRFHAGRRLADELADYRDAEDTILLALPRGGVPVAYELASRLHLPLDLFLVRKLGVPGQPELAMGAIASGGIKVLNEDVIRQLEISPDAIEKVMAEEREELRRRERAFRDDEPYPDLHGKRVILVDDGLATGASMRAAVEGLRTLDPASIVVAVPVAAVQSCRDLEPYVDRIICLATPQPFYGVGVWYDDFTQTDDEQVRELLGSARQNGRVTAGHGNR
jgi:putative phosphoribosyl transferase